jgi:hypothetical protein
MSVLFLLVSGSKDLLYVPSDSNVTFDIYRSIGSGRSPYGRFPAFNAPKPYDGRQKEEPTCAKVTNGGVAKMNYNIPSVMSKNESHSLDDRVTAALFCDASILFCGDVDSKGGSDGSDGAAVHPLLTVPSEPSRFRARE